MKEGFDYSKDRKNIVNENVSEAEQKHWATFEPTVDTPHDASQEEIIAASLDRHEDIFGGHKELFGSEKESKEVDQYQQRIREKGKKLYQIAVDLYDSLKDLYEEDCNSDVLTQTLHRTKIIDVLQNAIRNKKYILKKEDELSEEQLNTLGLPDHTEYEITQLIGKLETKENMTKTDMEIIESLAGKFEAQAHELMFMDTTEEADKRN